MPPAAPESRASMLLGVNIGLMALATGFIFSRFYTRYVVLNRLGSICPKGDQDCACLPGISAVTEHGLGRHVDTLPQPDELKIYTQHLWFSVLWYNTAIMSTKLALLAQYYRVLPIQSVRRACVTLMAVIGIWGLCQVLLSIFTCFPIQAYWDKDLSLSDFAKDPETTTVVRCIPALPLAYQNAAGNIATYVAVLVLPLPALGNLRLPHAQKCLLIGIFCLGFFTCGIAATRIMYFREYTDPTWEHVDPSILSLTELCSGTICLCLPTLRPLVARWLPPSLTSTAASIASHTKGGTRSTTNRSPVDNNNNPGGNSEKAALDPRRPPPCVHSTGRGGGGRRAGASCYYNSSTTATSASSSRRPSASLPRSSASGSDSDFIYGLETARTAVPAPTTSTTPSPPPLCMSIMRPMTLGSDGAGSRISRRSPVADTSSVVRFAAMPAAPFSSSSSSPAQQQQGGNYYVHRSNNQGSYFRGETSGNWLLESRVSTEIGVSNSPVPSEERRALGSAAIRVKRMVTRRESVVAGW
ncbi:hypothetical protein PG984_013506 [Apiospora sp. TS-2023a]